MHSYLAPKSGRVEHSLGVQLDQVRVQGRLRICQGNVTGGGAIQAGQVGSDRVFFGRLRMRQSERQLQRDVTAEGLQRTELEEKRTIKSCQHNIF